MLGKERSRFTFRERTEISRALKNRESELEQVREPIRYELLAYARELFKIERYGDCLVCSNPVNYENLIAYPEVLYCGDCYELFEDSITKNKIKEFLNISYIKNVEVKQKALQRIQLNTLLNDQRFLYGFNKRISGKFDRDSDPQIIYDKIIKVFVNNLDYEEVNSIELLEYYKLSLKLDFDISLEFIPLKNDSGDRWLEVFYSYYIEDDKDIEERRVISLLNSLNLKASGVRFVFLKEERSLVLATSLILKMDDLTDNSHEQVYYFLVYYNSLLKKILENLEGVEGLKNDFLNGSPGWSMSEIVSSVTKYVDTLSDDLAKMVYTFSDSKDFRLIFPLYNEDFTSKGELSLTYDQNELYDDGLRGFIELPVYLSNEKALKLVEDLNSGVASPNNRAPWLSGNWINIEQERKNIILYSIFIPNRFRKYALLEEHLSNIISEVVKAWDYYLLEEKFLLATEGEFLDES